jgi:hypothetical protein
MKVTEITAVRGMQRIKKRRIVMLPTKAVFLKGVLIEAKKMNPSRKFKEQDEFDASVKIVKQLKFYSEVQEKTLRFSSDFDKSDIAFSKNQLALLIIDALEPDYGWQNNQFHIELN